MPPKKAAAGGKEKKEAKGKEKKAAAVEEEPSEAPGASGVGGDDGDAAAIAASVDFEAGVMFNKADKSRTGVLTADDFRQLWREAKETQQQQQQGGGILSSSSSASSFGGGGVGPSVHFGPGLDPAALSFEAGKIFASFDANSDGRLDKQDFENLMRSHPELLRQVPGGKLPPPPSLPTEVISGRLLTHFDETAGVAIPRTAVEQHRSMGNTVTPLLESYRARYDRLRGMLTGRLLPRREHLLQLRRQLQNCSAEVTAKKKGIERETLTDAEQIIERLRAVESMRQSSIKHQVLQIEEELEAIERIVRRVEQANEDGLYQSATGVLLTSAAPGSTPVETVRPPRAASMVELIQQFADLSSTIERLSSKSITVQVDFPTEDFPKETAERLEVLARCDKYMHALSVKDHMLWSALQEKERVEDLLAEERRLSHEYAQEVASWAEMSQTLSQQVIALKQEKEKMERRNKDLMAVLREHGIFYAVSGVRE